MFDAKCECSPMGLALGAVACGPRLYVSTRLCGVSRALIPDEVQRSVNSSLAFHHGFTNGLPLRWAGFEQSVYYYYVLEDLTDLDAIWSKFDRNLCNYIRKAQQLVEVIDEGEKDVDLLLDVVDKAYLRQGMRPDFSREFVRRWDKACAKNAARKIFFAVDSQRRVHAALYFVWDQSSAHALIAGGDPELRSSQAASLLFWEAIRFSSTVTKSFNFAGSMIEPIEHFLRQFGGSQKQYYRFRRANSFSMRMLEGWRAWSRIVPNGRLR